jgi:hypothetical protein
MRDDRFQMPTRLSRVINQCGRWHIIKPAMPAPITPCIKIGGIVRDN